MAQKPDDKFLGAWLAPDEMREFELLRRIYGEPSRSSMLRRIIAEAAERVATRQNGHITKQPQPN